jgi:hypothetical protein
MQARLNIRKCKSCGLQFQKVRPLQSTCSIPCAIEHANKLKVANKRTEDRLERVKNKKAIEGIKTKSEWLKEAQKHFNLYIRTRDEKEPCISCGRHHQGQYHAGHYRTCGSSPHLRFSELNTHKQCAPCNNHLSGNIVNYRIGLIQRIGMEKVLEIESDNAAKHYTIDEIKAIKIKYKQLTKELKERNQ